MLLTLISTYMQNIIWILLVHNLFLAANVFKYTVRYAVRLPYRPDCYSSNYSTVEPLSNDHPHQRPSLLYNHISCDGQCFLFVRSLTDNHPSKATSNRMRWNFHPRGRPHRVFQNDCGMNVRERAAHFTYNSNRWQYSDEHKNIAYRVQNRLMTRPRPANLVDGERPNAHG